MRRTLSAVLVLVAMVLVVSCRAREPIKIGAIVALTGAASHLVDLRDGLQLAVDEVNGRGGVNGRKIQLLVADSKSDPAEAEAQFERLERDERPLLYVGALSSVALALAPLAEQAQAPLVALVTSAADVTTNREWVFRYYAISQSEVAPILRTLDTLGVKTLGVLYQNEAYGKSVFDRLSQEFRRGGGRLVAQPFDPGAQDLRPQAEALKNSEAVYVVGYAGPMRLALQQLRRGGYTRQILAASGIVDPAGRAMPESEGVYCAAPLIYNTNYLPAREARDRFETAFARAFTHQGGNGYDFVRLLADLLTDQELSRRRVREILNGGFIYSGVFGEVNVAPGEHDFTFPLVPARIVGGELRY